MTTVYFVRHAQPNYDNHNNLLRELTPKGLGDRKQVTDFLETQDIDAVISSPCKRAVDTVKEFADRQGLQIELMEDFRERIVGTQWIRDFNTFAERQWSDFSYKLTGGESLKEVQQRNMNALQRVLRTHSGKNIVIGSHGTALSTVIHYYDPAFGYDDFCRIKALMPWIVKLVFDEQDNCIQMCYDKKESIGADLMAE